jgi:hypothetical protein
MTELLAPFTAARDELRFAIIDVVTISRDLLAPPA